jgi:pSer/pThr/pTyr-binding forkhead associated (FHA) protein
VTIGRDLSNDLVIESPEVSRFHAELHTAGSTVAVSDRNSLNGTFVNGLPVAGQQSIDSGDQIVFGTTICRFWRELL